MNDTEINKALALAIGYREEHVRESHGVVMVFRPIHDIQVQMPNFRGSTAFWHVLNHKDWRTIAPIAAKYDAFPNFCDTGNGDWWVAGCHRHAVNAGQGAETPQKSIALAVIAGVKYKRLKS